MKDDTVYSDEIKGTRSNYHWPVRFELSGGYLGISQTKDDRSIERVLLSPKQVKALIAFVSKR